MVATVCVLLINFVVLLTAALGFTAAARRGTSASGEAAVALGLAVLVISTVAGAAAPILVGNDAVRLIVFLTMQSGVLLFALGASIHYRQPYRIELLAFVLLVSTIAVVLTLDLPRESVVRHVALTGSLALGCALVAGAVLRAATRDGLDWLLFASAVLLTLKFALAPLVVQPLGGIGADSAEYLSTHYALVTLTAQTIGTVILIATFALVAMRASFRTLERRTLHDPLTGLLNRRGLEMEAARIREKAQRRFRPVSVIVTDIDHFKLVNDTFGHAAGDVVIRAFSTLLEGTSRQHDAVARVGGEEFVVILADASPKVGRLFAEGVRVAFGELALPATGNEPSTASFGVAELTDDMSLDEAIHRADAALYRAKRNGRNRVEIDRSRGTAEAHAA